MMLIPVTIMILACYIFYSTSKRAVYRRRTVNHWFLTHPGFSKILTVALLAVAFSLFISFHGVGVGIFLGLTALMTIYGYLLLFYPLIKRARV